MAVTEQDAARGQRVMFGAQPITYRPATLNIATTPSGLNAGALERHLRRHPGDRLLKPLLEGVFAALEQADILGSLLRPGEHIEAAIKALQQPHTIPMDFDADDAQLRRTITAMARHDPAELKRMLLDRVAQSFAAERGSADDVAAQLFGGEAERGVRLLQLLDRKYAVVATNPPYMGSGNMDAPLKKYVEQHFKPGKRDLYAAFMLRCLGLCRHSGRVARITQQSWMFLRSFAEMRAGDDGLLRTSGIEALAHLGEYGFEDTSAAGAFTAMFVLLNAAPHTEHRMVAFRLVGIKSPQEKAKVLREAAVLQ